MHKKIAVLPGDGIGPEVMEQTLCVLNAVANKFNHTFDFKEATIGGAAYDKYGSHCPAETLKICEEADAILFGSVGGPVDQQDQPRWHNCEANSLLKLRQHFKFNINIRPIQTFKSLLSHSSLKSKVMGDGVDCMIFRELNGGIYFGEHTQSTQNGVRSAKDVCVYDEKQIRSIVMASFQASQSRSKKLCSVDKANVLATSRLWREIVNEVAKDFADIEVTHMYVDNCAMQMVLNPRQFDVIVTENMFGDIISDLASVIPGSIGMVPSASQNNKGFALYEPSGGSAPDIAGLGVANPCAQMLSAAMMLHHSFSMIKESECIVRAINKVIESGCMTKDLSKNYVSTVKFTNNIVNIIDSKSS